MIAVTDLLVPDSIKKQALLFDTFTHPFGDFLLNAEAEGNERYIAEISWLIEEGIIVDMRDRISASDEYLRQSLQRFTRDFDKDAFIAGVMEIAEQLDAAPDNIEQVLGIHPEVRGKKFDSPREFVQYIGNDTLRALLEGLFGMLGDDLPTQARQMAADLRREANCEAFALLSEVGDLFRAKSTRPKDSEGRKDDVVRIVLKRFPSPDDSVPWEQIVSYRKDPDSKGKMLALRNWMHEVARSELSQQEIEDKLDWLIYNYEKHLQLHRMKYRKGVLESVVTVGAEFLEGVAKLKWADAAKSLFSLRHQRIALLEAEMQSPGSEIAYVVETANEFG